MSNPFGITKASDISKLFRPGVNTDLSKDKDYEKYTQQLQQQRATKPNLISFARAHPSTDKTYQVTPEKVQALSRTSNQKELLKIGNLHKAGRLSDAAFQQAVEGVVSGGNPVETPKLNVAQGLSQAVLNTAEQQVQSLARSGPQIIASFQNKSFTPTTDLQKKVYGGQSINPLQQDVATAYKSARQGKHPLLAPLAAANALASSDVANLPILGAINKVSEVGKIINKGEDAARLESRAPLSEVSSTGTIPQIKNLGSTQQSINRLSDIDNNLVSTKKVTNKTVALATERQSLIANLPPEARKVADDITTVSKTAINSQQQIPTLAKKTEARAIANGLTKGFDNLPTDVKANFTQQAQTAVDLTNTDYKHAVDIALGNAQAPEGLLNGAVYKAVEAKATVKGDTETLRRLAEESTLPQQFRERGREIGVLGVKDPNSPVDAIREINNLREAAKARGIKIPQRLSIEEGKQIIDLAQQAEKKKQVWLDNGGKINDKQRLDYGRAQIVFRNHVNGLKAEANKKSFKEKLNHPVEALSNAADVTKSLQSSMDDSALFRQGWKSLWTHPGKWAKNALKSFQDMVKAAGNKPVLDELAADIISRPNADLYKRAKLAVGIDEEAYPSHIGEKIPLLGRAYKASEAAFVSFLQRQRADIFDKYIDIAQKTGVDLNNDELKSIGRLVNGLTSRGHLGKIEPAANALNRLFFSPRLLKSHFEVLGGHVLTGAGGSNFVRKQAALNLLKIISGTAAVLGTAEAVKPGSVEWDPRSSNFGKIKIGNTRFDVTGGMGSLTTLASRLATLSSKSSTSGDITSLTGGGFGSTTGADTVESFLENKLSPVGGVVRDILRGQDFNGNKPTAKSIAEELVTPLEVQNVGQLQAPQSANKLASIIADGLGISANSYSPSPNWKTSTSKELQAFKQKVGEKQFTDAYNQFDQQYNNWYSKIINNSRFKNLSNDDRQLVRLNKSNEIRDNILKQYNFSYKSTHQSPNRLKGF